MTRRGKGNGKEKQDGGGMLLLDEQIVGCFAGILLVTFKQLSYFELQNARFSPVLDAELGEGRIWNSKGRMLLSDSLLVANFPSNSLRIAAVCSVICSDFSITDAIFYF